ncbi:MAG: alkanesulfonate transporter substrate-binding subunit [Methanosaeta sp. PtaU1.Bin028]|nr:MAG: alkanesulfonate transporter substrate-binding subunit [Methanosaeta sp. PtaU1.Bin028]
MRSQIIIAVIALAVVATLGCISEKKAEVTTLNIGYQPSTHQIAEMVAMEKGWWLEDLKPFGITEIKEFEFPSGPPEMQAMLAGSLDVAYVGTAPPISAIASGLDAKIVAAVNTNGSDLVLRPDKAYLGPSSLEGMSIGTFPPGSIQDTVMKKWLQENGVDIDKVRILPMGPGDAVTAISAGKVDGIFLPAPSPSIVILEDKGQEALPSGQMWPNHACCSLVVSGRLIRDNPELVAQIVKTHLKATEYVNSHPEEAAEIYANRTKQDLKTVMHSVKNWDGEWVSDPHIQIPSTLEYAKVDYQMNYTQKELSEEELFDTSFFDRVKA